MAQYKVLQDIEGEDHLIGWLTPKQTIYAAIVFVSGILAYFSARANIFLAVPWLLPIGFFGFLAAPLGKDQPNDVWAAAQLRFFLKSRKRIWDQSGMEELVHITVPKRIERIYTDGLSQSEVRSRLGALSSTLDSRGWALKGAAVNVAVAPQFTSQFTAQTDDRLVGSEVLVQDVPISDVTEADDILDSQNNNVAHRFAEELQRQEATHKQQLMQSMNTQKPPTDYSFIQNAGQQAAPDPALSVPQLATFKPQVVAPGMEEDIVEASSDTDADAQALLEEIHHNKETEQTVMSHYHEKVIKTPAEIAAEEREKAFALQRARQEAEAEEKHRIAEQNARAKTAPDAILKELSQSELKVSTIASQAQHSAAKQSDDGEVVISLH